MKIDIHTHQVVSNISFKQVLALNADVSDGSPILSMFSNQHALFSLGIHPWNASELGQETLSNLAEALLDPRVLMVGEVGLDKGSKTPLDSQKEVFEAQLVLAESIQKPVLLHVVKAMEEVLLAKKRHPKVKAWIIHGFRGGEQTAVQYLQKGFFLSFGSKFNPEGLKVCPLDRLFLETDEGEECISDLYERVSQIRGVSMDELEQQVESNFRILFG